MRRITLRIKGMRLIIGKPKGNPYHKSGIEMVYPPERLNRYSIVGARGYFPDDTDPYEARAELDRAIADFYAEAHYGWSAHASETECQCAEKGLPLTRKGFQSALYRKADMGEMTATEAAECFKASFRIKGDCVKMPYNQWKEAVWGIIKEKAESRSLGR